MSQLLDPMHRRHIDAFGVVRPGARTLEVGCGNGSISAWLVEEIAPDGTAVAIDFCLIGRTPAPRLAALRFSEISGTAETAIYNRGSLWADYWIQTVTELRNAI
jgi:hypothetical protein